MRRILETLTLIARLPRRLPRVTLLLGLLLLLGGSLTGLHYYALYHWRRAEAAIQDSRLDEARESLSICLRVWPLGVRTHLLAARADRLSGKFDDAERHLKECLRLQKGANEDIQLEFLLMRVQAGDVDEVGSQLMLYVDKKHPDTASILETISGAYVHNLRYGPALAAIERWIVEVPGSGQPLQLRGWIMERLNSHEEAMRDYLQAVALSPELVPARLRLAEMYMDRSNPPAALPHLEFLHEQHPERGDVLARLGQCRFLLGEWTRARPLLESALGKLPDDVLLRIYLAKLEMQDNHAELAEQHLIHALKVDPSDTEARYSLVTCLQMQGRTQEAAVARDAVKRDQELLKKVTRLLQIETDQPSSSPQAPCEIGSIFLTLGQERLGIHWLNQALQRDPGCQDAHRRLADYYDKKGDTERAAPHRRKLTDGTKKSP